MLGIYLHFIKEIIMKKILLVFMCALMLVSVTACEDKVRDKEDEKVEETKKPQDADDNKDDKNNIGLGGSIADYVDKSKKEHDSTSCDYVKSAVAAAATVEDAYLEMCATDGKKWILITFDDDMVFSSTEDYTVLKEELRVTLEGLRAPKADDKVAYLATWIADGDSVINFSARTLDEAEANSYLIHTDDYVADES